MELSKQVISLDLGRKLRELGAPQDSYFHYFKFGNYDDILPTHEVLMLSYAPDPGNHCCAAYTVADLGEMLPCYITPFSAGAFRLESVKSAQGWSITYTDSRFTYHSTFAESEAEARGLMLVWLLENGYVKFNKEI